MSVGQSGNSVQNYSTDLTINVGTEAPNVFPTAKIDSVGGSFTSLEVTASGAFPYSNHHTTSTSATTSWLCPSGVFTLGVGNKVNVVCGGGGIYLSTSGPMGLHAEGIDTFSCRVTMKAQQIDLGGLNTTLRGKTLSIESQETSFANKVTFLNNVVIKGGLYVVGETFNTHSTTCGQKNLTSTSPVGAGFINHVQSFMVYNGCSNAAKASVQTKWKAIDGMPNKFGYIDAVIAIQLPGADEIYELPCQLAFPNGISMCSDSAIASGIVKAEDIATVVLSPERVSVPSLPDITLPPHQHEYIGSGASCGDSNEFAQAASACTTNDAVAASANSYNGWSYTEAGQKWLEVQTNAYSKMFLDYTGSFLESAVGMG
jgi:hypothetical protein